MVTITRRRSFAAGAAVIVLVLGSLFAYRFVANGEVETVTPYGVADYQALGVQSSSVSLHDQTQEPTEFSEIPGISNLELCAPTLGASAAVSLELTGAPVEVRVTVANSAGRKKIVLGPGSVLFDPGVAERSTHSFTFVQGPRRWPRVAVASAEWRSPNGADATLLGGAMTVLYDRDPENPGNC